MSVACKSISYIVGMIVEMEATLYHCVSPTKGRNVFLERQYKEKMCTYQAMTICV